MAKPLSDHETALAITGKADLAHPDGPLLESFLDDFVDRDRAAAFMLKRLSRATNTSKSDLQVFLADWKCAISMFMRDGDCEAPDRSVMASVARRDGGRCCITGLPNSFWDPLAVVPILPKLKPTDMTASPCGEMLEAFLTPKLSGRLLSYAEKESYDRVENHWLLRKSAAAAFAQGYFELSFYKSTKYEVLKNLTGGPGHPTIFGKAEDFRRGSFVDSASSNIKMPNCWALEILSRFANPLRWTYIAQEIASKQRRQSHAASPSPFSSISSSLSNAFEAILKTIWLFVPGNIRIRTYRSLAFLGARMYGSTDSPNVEQLPFGLYLKVVSLARRESLINEYATLELVRRHTNVPVPCALDLISDSSGIYLLTTRIHGYKLGLCIDTMSDEDTAALVHDLRRHITPLRTLPRPLGWKHAISNAVDGPCFDYRINAALDYDESRGEVVGPFLNEYDFNDTLRCGALPGVIHRGEHKRVFTHGDLNMRNILVDGHGRLAGIVDWENAGWFPEYWDYTKAYFVTRLNQRWLRMVDDVFGQFGDFQHELQTEKELWNYCF